MNPFCVAVNPAAKTQLNQSGDVDSGNGSPVLAALKGGSGSASLSKETGSKKISLKIMTLSNSRQKINDCLGNPVEIGIAVTWRVVDTVKAVFDVDNYKEFLSLQCDSALRNIVRLYPYDVVPGTEVDTTGDGVPDEGSLRGSSDVVAARIRDEIQAKVQEAGLEIIEARITHLAYASEIAAAMLQRQQASAIIDARKMIVEGAVGTVEMALDRLNQSGMVALDEERKAAMVSNLLVVLCANHDAQPVVNTGSLYKRWLRARRTPKSRSRSGSPPSCMPPSRPGRRTTSARSTGKLSICSPNVSASGKRTASMSPMRSTCRRSWTSSNVALRKEEEVLWVLDLGKKAGVWLSVLAVLVPLAVQMLGVYWAWAVMGLTPLFVVLAIILLAAAVAVIVAALSRIREINGGEEDDLSQY